MNNLDGNKSGTQNITGDIKVQVAPTPNITVGTTTTLEPGQSATVELDSSSTALNPKFNFGIPKGKEGPQGIQGIPGENGYTPQKGKDYWTDAEKKEIVDESTDKVLVDATNKFNVNYKSKETEFNENVEEKTTSFNDNADSATTTFNENATDKTTSYNQNAESKLNEYNENATNKTIEFNNNAASIKEDIKDLKSNQIKGTSSGTNITLNDSANMKMVNLEIDGVCEQETRSGKNLIDTLSTNTGVTGSGCSYTRDSDGKITIKGTTNRAWDYTLTTNYTFKAGKTYTLSIPNYKKNSTDANDITFYIKLNSNNGNQKSIIANSGNSTTFTIVEDETAVVKFSMSANKILDFTTYIQLEENSTATEYEAFGVSPSPDFPSEIKTIENSLKITSCNKNLLKLGIGSISGNNTTLISNDGILNFKTTGETNWVAYGIDNSLRKANYGDYVTWGGQVLKAGTYTLTYKYLSGSTTTSTIGSNFLCLNVYSRSIGDTNRVKTQLGNIVIKNTSDSITFTIDEDKEINVVIYLYALNATIDINFQVQLEQGSTATPYEQHLETQIEFNLPEGEFAGYINDTYRDRFKVEYNEEDGQYHLMLNKNIGKVVLNGSEDWIYESNYNRFKTDVSQYYDTNIRQLSICDYYIYGDSTKSGYFGTNVNGKSLYFNSPNSSITTIDTLKTWLSTHNVEVYYALATPYVVDLGIVEMPKTYKNISHITNSEESNMNIEYYKDIETLINNLTNAILTLGASN